MTTEHDKKSDEFIPINQILNSKPQLGPIPGEQVIPWLIITIGSYIICQVVLNLDWWATGLVGIWGSATWWILTGNESWRFLTKFYRAPKWTRGHLPYTSTFTQVQSLISSPQTKRKKPRKHRTRR
ncbi:hypothetical protein ACKFKG_22170 [Phormidesmis sp. 146-35]